MRITMTGTKELVTYLGRVQSRIPVLGQKMSEEVARWMQKSAKLRAPRDTGFLASTINIIAVKNGYAVTVDAPYGIAQELGFITHLIPMEFFQAHYTDPYARGLWVNKPRFFVSVSKSKPFIMPAYEATVQNLPNITKMYADRMVKK